MLHATPALEAPVFLSATSPESSMPKQLVLIEADLASRWAMSPKTLQRWLMTGNGPTYRKLGKRVSYPLNNFEPKSCATSGALAPSSSRDPALSGN